ncbi:MAG: PKD domain-containing protein [Bacteroidetes bacterium]|nr:MAG: PKD domain-containing protein [Bacteroidota bacterium]
MFRRFLPIVLALFLVALVPSGSFAQPCPDNSPVITGPGVVSNNQLGVIYSTPNIPGHTYAWTVSGGTIGSGAGTSQITINWGNIGTGTISLTETNPAAACSTTVNKTVSILPLLISYFYYTNTSCYGDIVSFWDASIADAAFPIVNYYWTFGDGGTSVLQNPQHQYMPPFNQTYTVTLVVTNQAGNKDTIIDAVYVNPDQYIPHPVFSSTIPNCLYTPVPFNSTASTTPPETGNIIHWDWNFGDPGSGAANISTLQNPTHVFSAPGTFSVYLQITNERYCKNDTTILVTIEPSIPDAQYTFTTPTCLNNPVDFTDLSTFPVGKNIVTWIWNFGDATPPVIINAPNSPNLTHYYPSLGPYLTRLTVITNQGCRDSTTTSIYLDPSPIADFSYEAACVGDTVPFTNLSQQNNGPEIVSYLWNFDDPASGFNTSTLENPSHLFSVVGTYDVMLITVNSTGCPDTIIKEVIVFDSPDVDYTWNYGNQNNEIQFHIDTVVTDRNLIGNMVLWNFDDGSWGYGWNPVHVYPAAGTFMVTLYVIDTIGCTNEITYPVIVPSVPHAFFASNSPVCFGQPVCFTDLSSVPSPPYGYITTWIWEFGDGSPNDTIHFPNDPNICHLYATVDTFAVTLHVVDNNGYTDSLTQNVIIKPNPIANFIYSTACQSQVVSFTDMSTPNGGGNIISWNWKFADPGSGVNNTSALKNPTHTFAHGDSTYLVRLIVVNFNNCRDTIIKPVYVFPSPPVNFLYDTACQSTLTTFWADTSVTHVDSIVIWSWNFGDGTPPVTDPITTQHLYASPGVYTVTLLVIDHHGCQNSVSHTVRVNPLPVANFTWNSPSCQGDSILFTSQSYIPPGYTGYIAKWRWNFGDGTTQTIVVPNSPNVYHTFVGVSTSYNVTLTVWSNDSCTQSVTKTVNLIPAPIANFSYSSTNCQNQPINFTNLTQTNGGGQITSYLWNFGDPASGGNNFSPLQNPSHTYATAGAYIVTLTAFNVNNCDDTVMKTVVVNPLPVANFTADTACLGSATTFTNLSIPNAASIISYSWNFGDGSPLNTQPAPTHIYASYGTYTVTLTIINSNGCVHSVSKSVLVYPLPVPEFSYSSPNCFGAVVTFTNQSSTVPGFIDNIVTWVWNFGDGTTQTINYPGNPNVTHTFVGTALSHTVRLTVTTSHGCIKYIEHVVNSIPAPLANFTFPGSPCAQNLVPFTDLSQPNGGGNIVQWAWNFDDPASGLNNNSNAQNPSHAFTTSGVFDVRLIVTNTNGCMDTVVISVTVNARPVANFSADTACLGNLTHFTDLSTTSTGTITSRYWEFGDGQTGTGANPTHLYTNPGSYSVKLTVTTSFGCTKDTTKQVIVYPALSAAFSYNSPACAGDSVLFTDLSNSPHGFITQWVWNFGDGTPPVTITYPASPNISHSYANGGSYTVTLTITNSDGCTAVKTNLVLINYAPAANFSFAANGCENIELQFTDLTQQNGGGTLISWNWDFDDPGSGTNNTSQIKNPTHAFSTGGTFDVTLTVSNINGCIDSISKTVTISDAPAAEFTADTACFGLPTSFTDASTTPAGTIIGWLWNFGDPASGSNNSSTLQNPTHVFTNIGTYNVTLTATNSAGCVDDTSMQIAVHPVPNAMFTYSAACLGSLTQFTDLSIAPGSTIVSWHWDFGDGTGTSDIQNPVYTYTAAGTYDVMLLVTNLENCIDSVIMQVIVRNNPTAMFSYVNFFCPAGQVNFQDESLGAGSTIVDRYWIFEPGYTGMGPNPIHVFSQTDTTYAVTLIVTDNYGCMDTVVDSVYVKPGFAFTFSNDSVCYGYPTHFQAQNLAEGDSLYSVAWNFGNPASGQNNISYKYKPSHTFTGPGTYIVKLKAWNTDNCVDSVYREVTVYDLPQPAFTFISEPCDSIVDFTDMSAPGGNSIASWEWHFGDGSAPVTINAPGPGNTSHLYPIIGTYNVTLIVTNDNGCVDSISETVQRYACISAIIVSDTQFCARNPVVFADSSFPVSSINQWHWTFGDGLDTTYTTYSETIPHEYAVNGTYIVRLVINAMVSGVPFTDSTFKLIRIRPTPEPYFANIPVCFNQVNLFTDTSITFGEPNTSWYWNFGEPGSGTSDTSTFKNPWHKYMNPGSYDVRMIVANRFGCSDSLTKTTRVFNIPAAAFESTPPCEGDPTLFTDLSVPSDTSLGLWRWNFGVPGTVKDTSNLQDPVYIYDSLGTYTVRMIVQDLNGCRDTIDSTLTVYVTPLSAFHITEYIDGMNGKLQMNNLSTGADGYLWSFGNGKTSDEENPIITYTEDGTYIIELISLNQYGCTDTTFFEYELLFKGLYIPNAFAPGSTNLAVRLFKPVGINLKKYHIQVFDNAGHLMWESTEIDPQGRPVEGWDGNYNGNIMPSGNYMWKVSATFIDNSPWEGSDIGKGEFKNMGTVILIR